MDFHSLRLSEFEKSRLAAAAVEKEAQEPPLAVQAPATSVVDETQGVREIAAAKPFLAEILGGQPGFQTADTVHIHQSSGFALATAGNKCCVWRYASSSPQNTLVFPGPSSSHTVLAAFVAPAPGTSEPGVLLCDPNSGAIVYWESVGGAVAEDLLVGSASESSVRVPLSNDERIIQFSVAEPAGAVITTSRGSFYLVNLRDGLGKKAVRVTSMRSGGAAGIFALLTGGGVSGAGRSAWRDVVTVKPGRQLNDAELHVYMATRRGDVAVWRVGVEGTAQVDYEVAVGALLHRHIDILYPGSGPSLQCLDLCVDTDDTVHILVMLAPMPGQSLRYFVVASLTPSNGGEGDPLVVQSLLRLQAYESQTGPVSFGRVEASGNTIWAIFPDAISLVEPRRAANEPRWEETLALKPGIEVKGATTTTTGLSVALNCGLVALKANPSAAHVPDPSVAQTKTRLEQAVFFTRASNPLDLERWPLWIFGLAPDTEEEALRQTLGVAAEQVAREIVQASSPYLPQRLPSLRAHLDLRLDKITKLAEFVLVHNSLVDDPSHILGHVRALAEAAALWGVFESRESDLYGFTPDPREWFVSSVDKVADLLEWIAHKPISDHEYGDALVAALSAGDRSITALGVADTCRFSSVLVLALENLTHAAVASGDAVRLAPLCELLGLAYSSQLTESRRTMLTALLRELSRLGSLHDAQRVAERFQVWDALAQIVGEGWLHGDVTCAEETERFLVVPEFASALFEFLVSTNHVRALLTRFVPSHRNQVVEFLKERGLQKVAWTVEPSASAELLLEATERETKLKQRKRFASLAKLAAINEHRSPADADRALALVSAQESLEHQARYTGLNEGTVTANAAAILAKGKLLSRDDAVDLLTFTPTTLPGGDKNLDRAWSLVGTTDTLRQRVLTQQLVIQTQWDRLVDARNDSERHDRARATLWYRILSKVPRAFAARISDSTQWTTFPAASEIQSAYPWAVTQTERDKILGELENLTVHAKGTIEAWKVEYWSQAIAAEVAHVSSVEMDAAEESVMVLN